MAAPHCCVFLGLASLLAPLAACVTEPAPSRGVVTEASSGVVVDVPPDRAWEGAQRTLTALGGGGARIDASARRIDAALHGGEVRVQVEAYDASRSILRVAARRGGAEDRALADEVLLRLLEDLRR